jgi:hypothetical protein
LSWSSVLSHSFFANTPIDSLAATSPPHYHDEPQPELLSDSELQIEQNVDSLAAAQKVMNNAAAMQKVSIILQRCCVFGIGAKFVFASEK